MEMVDFYVHHQMMCTCPNCEYEFVEDSGESAAVSGEEMQCPECETKFELGEQQ